MQDNLTAAFVRTVKEPGKHNDGKGTGLFLRVQPSGAKSWVQRLTVRGRRRDIGLGSLLVVSLAEAREMALDNLKLARAGVDPLTARRKARCVPTFREAVVATHAELESTWKNPKDRSAFLNSLERWVCPRLGDLPVDAITSADVRRVILAVRERVPGIADKLQYRIPQVFRWAVAEGHRDDNPAARGSLALPSPRRTVNHRKALPHGEVAGCLTAVQASSALPCTKLAFEFIVLTASRSAEARNAQWDEIEGDCWTIPADRAKTGRPHRVPLPPRALAVLAEARKYHDGSGLIFPGMKRGRPISDMTLSKLLRELGFDAHVHGFRATFRTWVQECTAVPREVAEAALAHKVGDAVERSYARGDMYERRTKLMVAWADYIGGQRNCSRGWQKTVAVVCGM